MNKMRRQQDNDDIINDINSTATQDLIDYMRLAKQFIIDNLNPSNNDSALYKEAASLLKAVLAENYKLYSRLVDEKTSGKQDDDVHIIRFKEEILTALKQ